MERALKERIVGAIVLVVFVVLVVPVFLDGPPDEAAVVSERVALPGQDEQPIKVVVLERDRSEPVPAGVTQLPAVDASDDDAAETGAAVAEAAGAAEPADAGTDAAVTKAVESPPPEPAVAEPERESRPAPVIQRSTNSATGMWAVQLGSFASEANANRLAADLRQKGFAAFLSRTGGDSGTLHRVRIGPQKDRPAAEAMAKRLADAGHKGQVVPHP